MKSTKYLWIVAIAMAALLVNNVHCQRGFFRNLFSSLRGSSSNNKEKESNSNAAASSPQNQMGGAPGMMGPGGPMGMMGPMGGPMMGPMGGMMGPMGPMGGSMGGPGMGGSGMGGGMNGMMAGASGVREVPIYVPVEVPVFVRVRDNPKSRGRTAANSGYRSYGRDHFDDRGYHQESRRDETSESDAQRYDSSDPTYRRDYATRSSATQMANSPSASSTNEQIAPASPTVTAESEYDADFQPRRPYTYSGSYAPKKSNQ